MPIHVLYIIHFDTNTEEVEIEAKLLYYINGKKSDVIYSMKKQLSFDVD